MFNILINYLSWNGTAEHSEDKRDNTVSTTKTVETSEISKTAEVTNELDVDEELNDETRCNACKSENISYQPFRIYRTDDKSTRVKTCSDCKQICMVHKTKDHPELLIVVEGQEVIDQLADALQEQAKEDAIVAAGEEETVWVFDVDFHLASLNDECEEIMTGGVYGVGVDIFNNFVEWGPVNLTIGTQRITSVLVTKDEFRCPEQVVCPVLRFKMKDEETYRWRSDLPFNPQEGVTKIDMSVSMPTTHHYER